MTSSCSGGDSLGELERSSQKSVYYNNSFVIDEVENRENVETASHLNELCIASCNEDVPNQILPRPSIVSGSNSIPTLAHFENFLFSGDNVSETPPPTRGRPSIVNVEVPVEEYPTYVQKCLVF